MVPGRGRWICPETLPSVDASGGGADCTGGGAGSEFEHPAVVAAPITAAVTNAPSTFMKPLLRLVKSLACDIAYSRFPETACLAHHRAQGKGTRTLCGYKH